MVTLIANTDFIPKYPISHDGVNDDNWDQNQCTDQREQLLLAGAEASQIVTDGGIT